MGIHQIVVKPLGPQTIHGSYLQIVQASGQPALGILAQGLGAWRALLHRDVGQGDADGRQDAGIPVHKDGDHAQISGDGAGMLGAGAAKDRQHVGRRIVPLHLGQGPDGAAHGFVGHPHKAQGDL